MKQVILSCPTLKKEILHLIDELNLDTPVYFLPKRLHSNPQELAEYLQNTIDSFANVDRILICVSGCGGGTAKLRATTAELVIPKTRDCVDILLSKTDIKSINRAPKGIFMKRRLPKRARKKARPTCAKCLRALSIFTLWIPALMIRRLLLTN